MNAATTVRTATPHDLPELARLFDTYRGFYGQDSNPAAAVEFLTQRLARNESTIFLASTDDQAVGFIQLYPSFSSVRMQRTFVLNDLFVVSTARRRGVASALLRAAQDYAREQGAIRLTLSTATDNLAGQALYASRGWLRDEQFFVYHFTL
jgi:ribosomal protein S18 acetylase RimI-like enzyme